MPQNDGAEITHAVLYEIISHTLLDSAIGAVVTVLKYVTPFSLTLLTLFGCAAHASDSSGSSAAYSGQQTRFIKSLSPEEIQGLKAGMGMGLAKSAELNHYPGPKHVLELAEPLELSPDQIASTQQLFAVMKQEAQSLGVLIIQQEKELDELFASGQITEANLAQQLGKIAQSRGRLRGVHLKAHLSMKQLLSDHQVTQYDRLRGYSSDSSPDGSGADHHGGRHHHHMHH
ncbi:MAG: hypothetical protein CMI09_12580 [Oceanospirillaceae bacterium]|nr:hypothetical protein [Oceanospirillaceae bacterium]